MLGDAFGSICPCKILSSLTHVTDHARMACDCNSCLIAHSASTQRLCFVVCFLIQSYVLLKGKLEPDERQRLIKTGQGLKEELAVLETQLAEVENELQTEGQKIPNLTHPDSPLGDEENAVVVKQVCSHLWCHVILL